MTPPSILSGQEHVLLAQLGRPAWAAYSNSWLGLHARAPPSPPDVADARRQLERGAYARARSPVRPAFGYEHKVYVVSKAARGAAPGQHVMHLPVVPPMGVAGNVGHANYVYRSNGGSRRNVMPHSVVYAAPDCYRVMKQPDGCGGYYSVRVAPTAPPAAGLARARAPPAPTAVLQRPLGAPSHASVNNELPAVDADVPLPAFSTAMALLGLSQNRLG